MHGLIHAELKRYVEERHGGPATWNKLLQASGLGSKMFLTISEYPDSDAVAIVTAASQATGKPAGDILEDFGDFIAPTLLKMYGALMKPGWKTLDVIEHTENTIHSVVRIKNKGAAPPVLKVARVSPVEVVLTYGSPRRMCFVAKGISKGLARHFAERVAITESACMHKGAAQCEIHIRKLG